MINTIARLAVMLHHNTWLSLGIAVLSVISFLWAWRVQNTSARYVLLVLALAAAAAMAGAFSVAPFDDLEHQHGSCLLESLQKRKQP